jgi:hypothetical protein
LTDRVQLTTRVFVKAHGCSVFFTQPCCWPALLAILPNCKDAAAASRFTTLHRGTSCHLALRQGATLASSSLAAAARASWRSHRLSPPHPLFTPIRANLSTYCLIWQGVCDLEVRCQHSEHRVTILLCTALPRTPRSSPPASPVHLSARL